MIDFEGRKIPITLREVVDPKRTVLLVWDMQNDQAGSSFNKEEFLRTTPPLISVAKKAGVRVVYTQSTPYLLRTHFFPGHVILFAFFQIARRFEG